MKWRASCRSAAGQFRLIGGLVPLVRETKGKKMSMSKRNLDHGAAHPYDGGADFWEDRTPTPPPATDWAHAAARGVLAELMDLRGIKWALEDENIDHETRAEIVQSLAEIIRAARAAEQS